MKATTNGQVDRRSFLRRTATITAGAAALIAANGVATGTAQAVGEEPISTAGLFVQVVVNGKVVGQFQQCTDIGTENEIVEYKTTAPDGRTLITKTPGRLRLFDVTLTWGINTDRALLDWRRLVEDGRIKEARRTVDLNVYDAYGQLVQQWQLGYAWPSELVTNGSTTVVESLTIVSEQVIRHR